MTPVALAGVPVQQAWDAVTLTQASQVWHIGRMMHQVFFPKPTAFPAPEIPTCLPVRTGPFSGPVQQQPVLALQWRHNECNGMSNHQRLCCLLDHLFRHKSKKTSKLHVTDLCEGNSHFMASSLGPDVPEPYGHSTPFMIHQQPSTPVPKPQPLIPSRQTDRDPTLASDDFTTFYSRKCSPIGSGDYTDVL